MRYEYECTNIKCEVVKVVVEKPMAESSRIELCEVCKQQLSRVYNAVGIVTSDGVKT